MHLAAATALAQAMTCQLQRSTSKTMKTPNPLCTGSIPLLGMTRRECLSKVGMGLGSLALGQLLHTDAARAAVPENAPALASPHFAPKGEARDLPLPERRSVATGDFRLKPALREA